MGLYKRGRLYWVKFKHAGKVERKPTGTANPREAEKRARRIRVEHEDAHGPGGKRPAAPLELLEALDIERAEGEGLGEWRIRTIKGLWSPMMDHWLPLRDVAEIGSVEVKRYISARRRNGIRTSTIRREVGALKRGMRLAKESGLLLSYPVDWLAFGRIRTPKDELPDERKRGKLWQKRQIDKVLACMSTKAVTAGHRDLCRFIMLTGLRLEEARRVKRSWVHPAPRKSGAAALLRIPRGGSKTGDPRVIPLTKEAAEILRRRKYQLPQYRPNHALKLASAKAEIPGVLTPRDLRHWYLTQVEKQTGSMESARALAGHRNAATTARYLHTDDDRAIAAGLAAARVASKGAQRGAHSSKKAAE